MRYCCKVVVLLLALLLCQCCAAAMQDSSVDSTSARRQQKVLETSSFFGEKMIKIEVNDIENSVAKFQLLEMTMEPTAEPSLMPSVNDDVEPSFEPTLEPTDEHSALDYPSEAPSTHTATAEPTLEQTSGPTFMPSETPSAQPSLLPTAMPSVMPSALPSETPSVSSNTLLPTLLPTLFPTLLPTVLSTEQMTQQPSAASTEATTDVPSMPPTQLPSQMPSLLPSELPTAAPFIITRSPTIRPSARPSISRSPTTRRVPTNSPIAPGTTAAPTVISVESLSFEVSQKMKGVTKQDYLFNKNANNQAFAKSVAKLIDGVQEADVTIESVEDDVNARRSLRAAGATTQAVGVVITYTIQVSNTQAAGFSNAQVAYDAIVNQITAAITSGSFTTELRRIAQEIGATVLTIVVIDETASFTEPIIILVPAPEPTTAKAEKKDKWLDAYTAAIVVAGVLILYFLLRSRFFHLYTARVKVHIHGKSAANVVLSKIVNEMPDSMYIHSNQSIRVKGEILYEVDSRDKEQFLFVCVHVKVDGIRSLKRERGCMSAWSEEICGDAVEETRSLVEADIKHIMDKFILRDFSTDIQVELNGVVVSTGHDGGIRADFNNNMLSQGIDEIMAVEGMSTRL